MPAIRKLKIQSNDLGRIFSFYAKELGLPILENEPHRITVQTGNTELTFVENEVRPLYHFAFNVSPNKIERAADWLESRGISIHPADGRRIVEFSNWNAHAVYFRDPDGNILEFIARHDMPPGDDEPFTMDDIQAISEIGIVVPDVSAAVERFRADLGFEVYKDSLSPEFAAMGDEKGLLIVVREGRTWFGSPNLAAAPFPVRVEFEGYAFEA